MKNLIHTKTILLLILLVAFLYRVRGLFNPLLDFHSWRQTDTASVAYNFYAEDMNIFKPRLNVFPEIRELEFHIYPYIVAVLYKIFGFHEYIGRLVSIFFGLLTLIFVYLIAKILFNEAIALLSAGFFAVTPLVVFYNRAFMPESAMMFFVASGVYFFLKSFREENLNNLYLIISWLLLSFAILTKATVSYLIIPLTFMTYTFKRNSIKHWLFIPLILVLPFLWYYYQHQVWLQVGQGAGSIWKIGTDKWFNKQILLNPNFYRKIWLQNLGEVHFSYTGYLFFWVGLFSKLDKKQKFLLVWVLATFFYFIVVAVGNYVHDYYQLPLLLPGSIFVSLGIYKFYQKFGLKLWWLIFVLWLPIFGFTKSAERMKFDINYKVAAEALAHISNPEDRILVISDGEPEVLYYSKRKGWRVNREDLLVKDIDVESYKKQGAKYLIILPEEKKVFSRWGTDYERFYSFNSLEKKFLEKLKSKYPVVLEKKTFVIFRLI